ncbi:MAG: hypothetical protein Q7R31_04765 [Candidatus Levybacteria bacterium]|nr:hypothetical protein [Candidatus Levybacteria bacterium]
MSMIEGHALTAWDLAEVGAAFRPITSNEVVDPKHVLVRGETRLVPARLYPNLPGPQPSMKEGNILTHAETNPPQLTPPPISNP